MSFAARIGRIRMKNGGAEVRPLPTRSLPPGHEDWRATIIQHARGVAEGATDESPLVGFFVIGFFKDGSHSCGFRTDDERSPIPRTLLPAFVEEIVRRYAVTKCQVGETIDEMS